MVGPTIQDDIFTLLLRFRTHPIAMKADITKMYRQFRINDDDVNYQRILWRENKNHPIEEFNLNTVTYGTSSAPFSATRCVKQVALDEMKSEPVSCNILLRDM